LEQSRRELEFERKHLEDTLAIVREQLETARKENEENREAIIAAKKELRENTSHSVSNLWSQENFLDLVNLSQYANQVTDKLSEYEQQAKRMQALEKMLDSPYFARIDFKFDGESGVEKIYIGRSSLQDKQSCDMVIYDWRSPIASVFYRFTTGRAYYDSPNGRITGEVELKRQYEIKGGQLEYYFDAEVQIVDEFLRKLLAQNASSQMKTIVETIQKEQDLVIRNMEADLLMVQGAAGSGKTSVALHRAAYLMYQGLAEKLNHNNILIISPNSLFERYIAQVLPELGENQVNSLLFDEILAMILGSKYTQKKDTQTKDTQTKIAESRYTQSRNEFLEATLSAGETVERKILKESLKFKGSSQFLTILQRFLADIPKRWIEYEDVYYDGKVLAARELLKAELLRTNREFPLGFRLKSLEKSILKEVQNKRVERREKLREYVANKPEHVFEVEEVARMLSIHESTVLVKRLKKFTELDCFELYKKLYSDKNYFITLGKGLELPDSLEEIIGQTQKGLQRKELQYPDVLALAYLQLKTLGYGELKGIKQVVMDEVQDYQPIHFAILKELFPHARYTVLGDIHQTIGKQEDMTFYRQISQILNKENATFVSLGKSFRCTQDILEFSSRFLNPGADIKSFSRKGEKPRVLSAPNQDAYDELLLQEIDTCQGKGYQSVGIICKTAQEAETLYKRLLTKTRDNSRFKGISLQLIKKDTEAELRGVFILPVYLSKGLEFDAVLIHQVNKEHYYSEEDKNLLYIASTRALHRLNLFYTGALSPLI